MDKITSFTGEYAFLSNFFPIVVEYEGVSYPTVEHAYQAAKTVDPLTRQIIRCQNTPGQAKRKGQSVELRFDWDDIKIVIMTELVIKKFQYSYMKDMLMNTGDAELIESNTWGDTFWGVCRGKGKNHLGKILMSVRNGMKLGLL